jgi:hypothetical protein
MLMALAFSGSVLAASSISPNALLGLWKEKHVGVYHVTYSFQKDHEFEFRQIYHDGSEDKESGAWQFGTDICWVSDTGTKGNLMIHLGTDRCCHLAYFLGQNLILSEVGSNLGDVCNDRVLVKDK